MYDPSQTSPDDEARFAAQIERANQLADERGRAQMEYEKRSEDRYGEMFKNGREYAKYASRQTKWIVEGLLPEGYLTILGATSKAGKTCFAHALAMSVAQGHPFLGMRVSPGAVLWCAYEESESERLDVFRQWPQHPYRFYVTHEKPLIDDPEGLEALRYWIYKTEATLIVIDPLYGATGAESLGDGRAARRALSGLKELCRKYHCTAIVLHHITKDLSVGLVRERFADSNQILATASMDMLMDSVDNPGGGRLLRIACRGRGDFTNRTLLVRSTGVTEYELLNEADGAAPAGSMNDIRIVERLSQSPTGMTPADLSRDLGLNLATVRNRVTTLLREGRISANAKQGRSKLYTAPNSSSQ